jgi:hypothetical protein
MYCPIAVLPVLCCMFAAACDCRVSIGWQRACHHYQWS